MLVSWKYLLNEWVDVKISVSFFDISVSEYKLVWILLYFLEILISIAENPEFWEKHTHTLFLLAEKPQILGNDYFTSHQWFLIGGKMGWLHLFLSSPFFPETDTNWTNENTSPITWFLYRFSRQSSITACTI
jgi:hypothetical protein